VRSAVPVLFALLSLATRAFAQEGPKPNGLPEPDIDEAPALNPNAGVPEEPDAGSLPVPAPEPASPPPIPPASPPAVGGSGSASEGTKRISKKAGPTEPEEEDEEFQEVAPRPSAKGDPFGDEPENGSTTKGFSFRTLLQTRYTSVFDDANVKDAQSSDGFALNRAFLRSVVHPYKWLSAKLLVDFAEFAYSNPAQALKLAYGEIRPARRLEVTLRSAQADLLPSGVATDRRIRTGRHRPY